MNIWRVKLNGMITGRMYNALFDAKDYAHTLLARTYYPVRIERWNKNNDGILFYECVENVL